MKQTARIISIYASDTAGVCSMLYELGGMTIVHDASGCNSTYTTHDEPRWYQHDSMIYISALTETDAILGNDARFVDDIVRAAEEMKPRFLALCGSPMPMMVGTDFDALAAELEQKTGLPVFGLHTNGMNSYLNGASQALCAYLKRFCVDVDQKKKSVNIIGATPLDFSLNGSVSSIRNWLNNNGYNVVSCMAMDSFPEEIAQAGKASVNLVVSSCGLESAEYLKNRFGTPFVSGVPYGKQFSARLLNALEQAEQTGGKLSPHTARNVSEKGGIAVVGESITASSFATALEADCSLPVRVLCPQALQPAVLADCDAVIDCEDSMAAAFADADVVFADPLFEPVCPVGTTFIRHPHEAFSGRCFSGEIRNFVCRELKREMFSI